MSVLALPQLAGRPMVTDVVISDARHVDALWN